MTWNNKYNTRYNPEVDGMKLGSNQLLEMIISVRKDDKSLFSNEFNSKFSFKI